MRKIIVIIITITYYSSLNGQTPHLSGDVHIDTKLGTIRCELLIENIPELEDYSFVLHKGMNLRYIKANNKTVSYNTDFGVHIMNANLWNGVAYIPNIDSIFRNTKFKLTYTAAFPVYDNNKENNDFTDGQVEIAFKNNILRAAYNTLWYPSLFDRSTKELVSNYTYKLNITSDSSSQSIFITGNPPHSGNSFTATSNVPSKLFLYVGNYTFKSSNNAYFLNSLLTQEQQEGIDLTFSAINDYYYSILNVRSKSKIVLGQIFSKGPENEYTNWAIAEYPVILADLKKLPHRLNQVSWQIDDPETLRLYAHELAHQFWTSSINTEYPCWTFFYSESFAEYFSLKALKSILDNDIYMSYIKNRYFADKNLEKQYTPLNQLGESPPRNVNPYYYYYSLLLIGFEQVVGEEKANTLFKHIIDDFDKTNVNYEYLMNAALSSGITTMEWNTFETEYVNSKNSLQVILNRL